MTVNEGLENLMTIKDNLDYEGLVNEDTLAIGIARVGSKDNLVKAGYIKDLIDFDFGGVGFRNSGDERGFIKKVYLEKL
jgi:diphthine synthase